LKQDYVKQREEIKLLLLGAGESGKTTIRNQMRFIEGQPPSEAEKVQFTDVCRTNMVSSMQIILDNMALLGIGLSDESLKDQAEFLISMENENGSVGLDGRTGEVKAGVAEAITALWRDAGVQTCFNRSNEYQLNDSAEYFIESAARIAAPDWTPNDMDILKARVKTTGISETKFVKEGRKFTVVDVGGQRSERRKWLHCFESVTSLLYVVALNEYNMMLREDETVNRMQEAEVLYHSIVTSPYFKAVPVILFLNKADLLRRKCRSATEAQYISNYYSDFTGDPKDWKQVFRFIEKLFMDSHRREDVKDEQIKGKKIYAHMCTATDSKDMKAVLSATSDIILRSNIEAAGLV